jgi:hypothetical protein
VEGNEVIESYHNHNTMDRRDQFGSDAPIIHEHAERTPEQEAADLLDEKLKGWLTLYDLVNRHGHELVFKWLQSAIVIQMGPES